MRTSSRSSNHSSSQSQPPRPPMKHGWQRAAARARQVAAHTQWRRATLRATQHRQHPGDYLVEIIPPRAERRDAHATADALALENLFQSLLLSARDPLALEVYGAPHERRLLARATSVRSLAHLCAQLRAHAPQVELRRVWPQVTTLVAATTLTDAEQHPEREAPLVGSVQRRCARDDATLLCLSYLSPSTLTRDPLVLAPGERMHAVELRPQGGAHLPLKLYQRDELSAQGVDPLFGVLAAMEGLPPGGRAVAQLALALAPERWSQAQQRRAVEHPLAQEQAQERAQVRTGATVASGSMGSGATGLSSLAPLALVGLLALALSSHVITIQSTIQSQMRGGVVSPLSGVRFDPMRLHSLLLSLTAPMLHVIPVPLLLSALLAFMLLMVIGLALRARLGQTAIYSMRLVEERTTPIAARTCLTLLAITPAPVLPPQSTSAPPALLASATVEQQQHSANGALERLAHRIACARAIQSGRFLLFALKRKAGRLRMKWSVYATLDHRLDQTIAQLVAAYRQHHLASGAFFVARRRGYLQPRRFPVRWARRVRRSHDLLNVRELAALWHLPQGETETPLLERGRAHTLLAPVAPLAHGYRLGVSTQADLRTLVRLPQEALRHNTLLVAKTGKGKSSLLLHLALAQLGAQGAQEGQGIPEGHGQDVGVPVHVGAAPLLPQGELRRRRHATDGGLIVIDPHGDLVSSLLTLVPPARRDDVILVDLADTAYPVALNPLDTLLGRDRDKAVEALLGILSQIWAKFWGPRMQNALEYALKTLYEANEALVAADPQAGPDAQFTLLDVAPILSSPGFRRDVLSLIHDQALRTWWTHYYKPLDPRLQLEIINPVLTKMAAFSGSRVARRIVGQGRSTLDLTEIVRDGRTLLVNTAKGVVGAETATLVGATLLGALQVALQEQAQLAPEERQRFLVVIDEFQSILGVDYAAMLSELRKFGGSFALATQALAHLDALDPTLRPTVLANVDNLFAFATSAEDGRTLARELDDAVTVSDLINLDDFYCYAKVTLDRRRLPVFSLALDPPPTGDADTERVIRRRARARYAHPREAVEEALTAAAARYLPAHEVYRPEDATDSTFVAAAGSVGATRRFTAPDVVPAPVDGRNDGRDDGQAAQRASVMGNVKGAPTTNPEGHANGDTGGAPQAGEQRAPRATRRGRYGYRVGASNAGTPVDRLPDGLLMAAADVWTGLGVTPRRAEDDPPVASSAATPATPTTSAMAMAEKADRDDVQQHRTSESSKAQDATDDRAENRAENSSSEERLR